MKSFMVQLAQDIRAEIELVRSAADKDMQILEERIIDAHVLAKWAHKAASESKISNDFEN